MAEAISLVRQGIAEIDAVGTAFHRPHCLSILAELHAQLGNHTESLRLIEDAHRQVMRTEEHFWHADLCRIEGELRHQAGAADAEVEACFISAIDRARQQDAKSFELRAATSLARLWRDQGRHDEARTLLAPVYGWFTEGFDTPDLMDAKALLGELAARG